MRQLLNPYPEVRPEHPLIVREARRLRWLKRAGSPERYSVKIILLIISIVLLLYVGWLIHWWLQTPNRPLGWTIYIVSTDFLKILAGASLLASIPLDFVSITSSLNSISSEIANGTWDLLRLTAVREGELVLAKHTTTQFRAWRTTMWVIGLRIAVFLIAAIVTIGAYLAEVSSYWQYRTVQESAAFFLVNLVPFAALFGVFILEPLWRMRAMTALGMVISARLRDDASAALLAIAMVMALWLTQAIVITAVVAGLSALLFVLSALSMGALCAPIAMVLVIFPTVYGFYSLLKTWSLRQVARHLFVLNR